MPKTRIYVVNSNGQLEDKTRLVKAQTSSQALRHVAGKKFQVRRASSEDVAELMASGTTVENADAPAAEAEAKAP